MVWPDPDNVSKGETLTPPTQQEIAVALEALVAAMNVASVVLIFFPGAALAATLIKAAIPILAALLGVEQQMKSAGVPTEAAHKAITDRLVDHQWVNNCIKEHAKRPS